MKLDAKHKFGMFRVGAVLAVTTLLLSIAGSLLCFNLYEQYQRKQTRVILELTRRNIENTFLEYQNVAGILAYSMEREFDPVHFDQMSEKAFKKDNCLYAYLISANTVVGALPQAELAGDIGKKLQAYPYAFSISQVLQKPVVDGPIAINGSPNCFLFAHPIFKGTSCIGQTIIVVDADYLLEKINLNYLRQNGYAYEFWRIDIQDGHKSVIQAADVDDDLSNAERVSFFAPTEWVLLVAPENGWLPIRVGVLIFLANLLACSLISICALGYWRYRQCSAEKKAAVFIDQETGLLNYGGFLKTLREYSESNEQEYTVFLFTMDEYLPLSRKIGQSGREQYIKYIVSKLQKYIYNDHIIGRVGESSFVVAVFEKLNKKQATELARGISLELLWKTELNGERAYIHAAWSLASYPDDGVQADELLERVVKSR